LTIEIATSDLTAILKLIEEFDNKIHEISRNGVIEANDREVLDDIMGEIVCKIFNSIGDPKEAINFANALARDQNRRGDKILAEAIKFLTEKALKSVSTTEKSETPTEERPNRNDLRS
jgi:hypothetical protein